MWGSKLGKGAGKRGAQSASSALSSPSSPSCNPVQSSGNLPDHLIRAIQGEIALGRLSHHEIAVRYRVDKAAVRRIAKGTIRTAGQGGRLDVIRQLQAWREQLLEPLGVFEGPGEPPADDEADLSIEGAGDRLQTIRRAQLERRRRDRVIRE